MKRYVVIAMIYLAGCGGDENANTGKAIVSSVKTAAGEVAERIKEFDSDTYSEHLSEWKGAIETSDYTKAVESAEALDAIIGNDTVSNLTQILIVRLEDGREAADAALEIFSASSEFGNAAKAGLSEFKSGLVSVEKKDIPGILAIVVYIALESKISHAAAVPAAAVQAISAEVLGVEVSRNDGEE